LAEKLTVLAQPLHRDASQRLCSLIAIETSGRVGSVALAAVDRQPRLIQLAPDRRTAVTLPAAIAGLIDQARDEDLRIDGVAVANGPGSFTGLRIGVTAAKMLAYALNCPVVAVDTLAAMAAGLWRQHPGADRTTIAINAYRQQLFVARWTKQQWTEATGNNTLAAASQLWPVARWHSEVAAAGPKITLAAEESVARSSPLCGGEALGPAAGVSVLAIWPTAQDVAQVALGLAAAGHFLSPLELKPNYLRDSAAEEKLR
jgi:tRNA threonylcarbamoyladenosine biosynthesis protein TsaB